MDRKRTLDSRNKTKAKKDAKLRKEFVTQSELRQMQLIAEVEDLENKYYEVRKGLVVGFM